jgi:hypothetical protein
MCSFGIFGICCGDAVGPVKLNRRRSLPPRQLRGLNRFRSAYQNASPQSPPNSKKLQVETFHDFSEYSGPTQKGTAVRKFRNWCNLGMCQNFGVYGGEAGGLVLDTNLGASW